MLPMVIIFVFNCTHAVASGFLRLVLHGQIREDGAKRYERLRERLKGGTHCPTEAARRKLLE